MINILIDESLELNDKVLVILSSVGEVDLLEYHFYDYTKFLNPKINQTEINLLKIKFGSVQKEIETDFKIRLGHALKRMELNLEEALKLEKTFLLDYLTKKDPNDLIITTLCLETLWYHKFKSRWFEDSYPSLSEPVNSYDECLKFMTEFCPEVVLFNHKAMKRISL